MSNTKKEIENAFGELKEDVVETEPVDSSSQLEPEPEKVKSSKSSIIRDYESFDEMKLDSNLLKGIYAYGFEKPSAIQQKAIIPISTGKEIIAQAQSGTGKTGSFIIGMAQRLLKNKFTGNNEVLILAPTRELAIQIHKVCEDILIYTDLKVELFIGGTFTNRYVSNQVSIGTPGRIFDLINRNVINNKNLKILILDEADEMLSRGFTEQVNNIYKTIQSHTQVVLLSATMPQDIINIADKMMNKPLKILVKNDNLTLEGIRQYYVAMEKEDHKVDTLCDLYKVIKVSQCIIYINSKKKTEWLSQILNDEGFPVSFIHGSLEQRERKSIMDDFRAGKIKILITTDILSRGIDIQQVSLVINYDLPKETETYIHRIGRSGRFGRKGTAINFVSNYDISSLKTIEKFYNTVVLQLPADVSSVIVS